MLRDWLFLENLPIGGQNQQKIGKNSPDEESFPRFGEKEPIEEKCLTVYFSYRKMIDICKHCVNNNCVYCVNINDFYFVPIALIMIMTTVTVLLFICILLHVHK